MTVRQMQAASTAYLIKRRLNVPFGGLGQLDPEDVGNIPNWVREDIVELVESQEDIPALEEDE